MYDIRKQCIGWKCMISSLQNDYVKQWRKLHRKKERINTSSFIIEGFHLVEEARRSKWIIKQMIVEENVPYPNWCEHYPLFICTKDVFAHISQTKTPQGIAAVVEMKLEEKVEGDFILLLDQIQDPGNVGTMIRTADAAGFSAVIAGTGTVDMYNEKVIRATQGSLFHLPMIQANLYEQIKKLKRDGYTIWAATLTNAIEFTHTSKDKKVGLIVGNEGAGIQKDILELADKKVHIPIHGKAESLNVSVAAGVLMYYLRS